MGSDDGVKRLQVIFTGRVQGVGFRWMVCRIAGSFNVVGFVRNRHNGDVELVAEGDAQEVLDFVNTVRSSELSRHIVREQMHWTAASGKFANFGISI